MDSPARVAHFFNELRGLRRVSISKHVPLEGLLVLNLVGDIIRGRNEVTVMSDYGKYYIIFGVSVGKLAHI